MKSFVAFLFAALMFFAVLTPPSYAQRVMQGRARLCEAQPQRCGLPPDNSPCARRIACDWITIRDPFTLPQSRTVCTGIDWNLSWCRTSGCPRNCTAFSTEFQFMENIFIYYLDIPDDYDRRLIRKIHDAGQQCLAEGYRAAGWATFDRASCLKTVRTTELPG
jgi:hypothetical protein